MAQQILLELGDDNVVRHLELPSTTPPPGGGEGVRRPGLGSLRMVLINDANLSNTVMQKITDLHQLVIDNAFAYDWRHVELRWTNDVDDFDPAVETPHFFTLGLDVEGAAGYHSIVVNAGGDIDGIAFSDASLASFWETVGHEIWEWAANVTTSSLHQYWGDPNRMIMGEVSDPVSNAPHTLDGETISAWVTQMYLQGDNNEDPTMYDSSRWPIFGEQPRVTDAKQRTAGGFQIFFNLATRQIEYEFGPVDPSVPWQMRQKFGGWPIHANLTRETQIDLSHVERRCAKFYRNQQRLGLL